jgi:hypothetical protein
LGELSVLRIEMVVRAKASAPMPMPVLPAQSQGVVAGATSRPVTPMMLGVARVTTRRVWLCHRCVQPGTARHRSPSHTRFGASRPAWEMLPGDAMPDIGHLTDIRGSSAVQPVTVIVMSIPCDRWLPTGQYT